MRLLLDANLSPRIKALLTAGGLESTHVGEVGLLTATDEVIFDHAAGSDMVVVTADSDFPMLLAIRRAASPSVVLLRHVDELTPVAMAALLIANLHLVAQDLARGAVVSLSPTAMRVRGLPIE